MPHDFQHEAIAKFLIPDHPQEDNYPDPDEFEEKEKEWTEQRDWALACCAAWVEREQLAENRHVQEPSALVGFCHVIYKMQDWCIYAMHHVVDKITKDAGMASF